MFFLEYMATSFVSLLFHKKQKNILLIKVFSICLAILLFLYLLLHILNVFILNSGFNSLIEQMKKNEDNSFEYEVKWDFIKSKISIKDMNIKMKNGNIKVDKIKIKKKSGFVIPKKIILDFDGIVIKINSGKEYVIKQHGDDYGYILTLNRHFFKKPTFGGIKIDEPVKYVLMENGEEICETNIDIFNYIHNEKEGITEYKGSFISHKDIFGLSILQIDRPFKWDLKFIEGKTTGLSGLNGSELTDINNVKIEKMLFDLDFAKIGAKGSFSYSQILRDIDMELLINKDKTLLDNIFNMLLKDNGNNLQIKRLYLALKNTIIPLLKKKNDKSNANDLYLKIYKTEAMPEIVVNDYGISDLAKKINNLLK